MAPEQCHFVGELPDFQIALLDGLVALLESLVVCLDHLILLLDTDHQLGG
jgi:hypothetical protein